MASLICTPRVTDRAPQDSLAHSPSMCAAATLCISAEEEEEGKGGDMDVGSKTEGMGGDRMGEQGMHEDEDLP